MKLKTKFTLTILCAALLPLLMAMTVSLWHSTQQLRTLTIKSAQGNLRSSVEKLSGYFAQRISESFVYANTPVARTMDWQKIGPFLRAEFMRHEGIYEKLFLGTRSSHYYVTSGGNPAYGGLASFNNSDPKAKLKSMAKRKYWQYTVGNNLAAEPRTYVSDPIISYTTGVRQVLVGATILSKDGRKILGVVGGTIQWEKIKSLINKAQDEIQKTFGRSAKLMLVAQSGIYIYHWDHDKVIHLKLDAQGKPILNEIGEKVAVRMKIKDEPSKELARVGEEMIRGREGFAFFTDSELDQEMTVIYAPVNSANYSMALVIPKTIIMAPVKRLRGFFVAIALISIVLAIMVSLLLAKRIIKPIEALNSAAKDFAKGSWKTRLTPKGSDEVSELSGVFNEMAGSLEKREEALKESEEKYRTILESIEDGYYEVDLAGNFTFFNDSMCKISGYSRDELMGMNYRQYTNEQDSEKLYKTLNKVYTTGKPSGIMDHVMVRKDGTERHIELSGSLIKASEGHGIGFRGIIRDVTERKKLETQLQQARKMEAIATLAGGIAHEFNNALVGITGNIELLQMDLPGDEDKSEYIEPMKGSAHRIARLTNQLLAYARGGKYRAETISLSDFVAETLPVIQNTIDSAIRVETDLQSDIASVEADLTQMQMVLSAIVNNSAEAIEDKGRIRLTARNEEIDEEFSRTNPGIKPGSYACLTIEDDGKGMDEETRNRIFDPFFTSKFQGRGLGMAAVYGIVKNHEGYIFIDSEPGKGTVVRIYLSAVEVKEQPVEEIKTEPVPGSGTILLIDDEEMVLNVTRSMLEKMGYRVLEARTGKEAVDIARTFDGDIDLALLDIKLPDMEGGSVYPLIMGARPNLKVIVCSGYSIDSPAREILDAGAQGFIQKPYSLAALSAKLKEIFESK